MVVGWWKDGEGCWSGLGVMEERGDGGGQTVEIEGKVCLDLDMGDESSSRPREKWVLL